MSWGVWKWKQISSESVLTVGFSKLHHFAVADTFYKLGPSILGLCSTIYYINCHLMATLCRKSISSFFSKEILQNKIRVDIQTKKVPAGLFLKVTGPQKPLLFHVWLHHPQYSPHPCQNWNFRVSRCHLLAKELVVMAFLINFCGILHRDVW